MVNRDTKVDNFASSLFLLIIIKSGLLAEIIIIIIINLLFFVFFVFCFFRFTQPFFITNEVCLENSRISVLRELWLKEGNCIIISYDILGVIRVFCNHCIFYIFCLSFPFFRSFNDEHRAINLKFLVLLVKIPSQGPEIIQQLYGDSTMSWTLVFERCMRFRRREREKGEEVKNDSSWLQQARVRSTSSGLGKWCVAIVVCLVE